VEKYFKFANRVACPIPASLTSLGFKYRIEQVRDSKALGRYLSLANKDKPRRELLLARLHASIFPTADSSVKHCSYYYHPSVPRISEFASAFMQLKEEHAFVSEQKEAMLGFSPEGVVLITGQREEQGTADELLLGELSGSQPAPSSLDRES